MIGGTIDTHVVIGACILGLAIGAMAQSGIGDTQLNRITIAS
jgi:hypothetical protein